MGGGLVGYIREQFSVRTMVFVNPTSKNEQFIYLLVQFIHGINLAELKAILYMQRHSLLAYIVQCNPIDAIVCAPETNFSRIDDKSILQK